MAILIYLFLNTKLQKLMHSEQHLKRKHSCVNNKNKERTFLKKQIRQMQRQVKELAMSHFDVKIADNQEKPANPDHWKI